MNHTGNVFRSKLRCKAGCIIAMIRKWFTLETISTTHSSRQTGLIRDTEREVFSRRIGRYRFSVNSQAVGQEIYSRQSFFVCPMRIALDRQKSSLCDLGASVVKVNTLKVQNPR